MCLKPCDSRKEWLRPLLWHLAIKLMAPQEICLTLRITLFTEMDHMMYRNLVPI